jgi:hypothetical protein
MGYRLTFPCTQNEIEELHDVFYEGQENHLRILLALQARGLPVDVSILPKSLWLVQVYSSTC